MKNLLSRLIALNWLQWSFGPVVAFGFAGNLILLLCLIRYRAKITPINMIIGNMALADMMTIVIVPFGVVSRNIRYKNYYGEFLCRYNIFIEDVSSSVSYIMIALLCFQCWLCACFQKTSLAPDHGFLVRHDMASPDCHLLLGIGVFLCGTRVG